MDSHNSDPHPYHLIPFEPGSQRGLRHSDIAVISILAILVLGLLIVVFVPQAANGFVGTKVTPKIAAVHISSSVHVQPR